MIVDVHTHWFDPARDLGPRAMADLARCGMDPGQWPAGADAHLESTAAVDAAVVFGMRAAATGWQSSNERIATHVQAASHRLIFFAAIDPADEDYAEQLERCHQDLRCQGVKLGPIYQNVHPLDPRYRTIYAYCQRHGLPILVHMATTFASGTPLEYARPAHMDAVAVEYPELKIVLAHLGHPWEAETVAVIRRQSHVFADMSALYYRPWQFYNSMRLLTEYRAESKVLFGSDFPFTTPAGSLAAFRGMNGVLGQSGLPPVPAEVIEGIIHRDTLGLLGLAVQPRAGGRS